MNYLPVIKSSVFLALAYLIAYSSYAQSPLYPERLETGQVFSGGNTLHLDVTTPEYAYRYVFSNLLGRMDVGREQFVFTVPSVDARLPGPPPPDSDAAREMAFLRKMINPRRANPIIIRIYFHDGPIDLGQFEGETLTMAAEVQMGGVTYKTPVQVQGLYRNDDLIMDFSMSINNVIIGVARQAVQEIQLYAPGVRILGLTGQRL